YRLDGSARYLAHTGAAAFPLGLRHAAMYVETQGRALSSALWHARLHLDAERLDFPDIFPTRLSDHGLDVGLDAHLGNPRTDRTPDGVCGQQSQTGALLLCALSGC